MARSKVSESRLWAWLAKCRKDYGARMHACRIENGVMSGMPDSEGCLDGHQFWIELKCSARPVRATTKIKPKFQPGQISWLETRAAAGGIAYVLLQVASGHDASRYLLRAEYASRLEAGLTEIDLQYYSEVNCKANAADIIAAAAELPQG